MNPCVAVKARLTCYWRKRLSKDGVLSLKVLGSWGSEVIFSLALVFLVVASVRMAAGVLAFVHKLLFPRFN